MTPRLARNGAWISGGAAGLVLLLAAAGPATAESKHEWHGHARHEASNQVEQVAAQHRPVRLLAFQHLNWGRLTFVLDGNASPTVVRHPSGVELRFAPGTAVTIPDTERLRQIGGIDLAEQDGAPVALIRLGCGCTMTIEQAGSLLRLDVRENPRRPGGASPARTGAGTEAAEMETLRSTLAAKIALLNAPPPGEATAGGGAASAAAAAPAAAPAPPPPPAICLPTVDMRTWRNDTDFVHQLVALRAGVAYSHGAARDLAALTEFYLAYGLGEEALAVASDALTGELSPEERIRLTRDADIARLLKGETIDAAAPLLASPPNCNRTDAPLWRALAAAAANHGEGAARDADAARIELRHVPEPLLERLAYRIAGAVKGNQSALLAMAGAVRNTTDDVPEDAAARFLLLARIAEHGHDQADEAAFLQPAARYDLTVPGITAKGRLAALQAAQEGPVGDHAEAVLADIARTYRYEALGQQAAQAYAERRMRHGDYVAALAMADASAGPPGADHSGASVGAALAARILRILLVEPGKALPAPADRVALYWRYQGYATPGVSGDDIRLGAARLMLAERLPDAALTVLKQLADVTAAKPDVVLLRATAEARAGDPAVALTLLQSQPDNDAAHRIAADALERMGRVADAARRLDGAKATADQLRRAGLLFKASAWQDAATAYAAVLHAPDLAGGPPPATAPQLPASPSRLLAVLPGHAAAAAPNGDAMSAVPAALERAKRIEGLLDPAPANQGS